MLLMFGFVDCGKLKVKSFLILPAWRTFAVLTSWL